MKIVAFQQATSNSLFCELKVLQLKIILIRTCGSMWCQIILITQLLSRRILLDIQLSNYSFSDNFLQNWLSHVQLQKNFE